MEMAMALVERQQRIVARQLVEAIVVVVAV